MLRISGAVSQTIVDGPGLRYTIYTQGCPHRCKGCHNPQTHDFDGGYDIETDSILGEFDANPILAGITLSGGEPLAQAAELLPLAEAIKQRGKNIVCFTGYVLEDLLVLQESDAALMALLALIDILVDGPYDEEQRSLELVFRGSRNQRILDLPASLASAKAVWVAAYADDQ